MKIAMLVAPLLISGCAKTDSSDLLTTGIYAQISARATRDGDTDVLASLFVGNPINLNYVDLTGDDRLIASHGGQDKTMTELIVLNVVSHHASFPTDNAGDSFEVSFERSIDDGAPSSIARGPAHGDLEPRRASEYDALASGRRLHRARAAGAWRRRRHPDDRGEPHP
jgi:hypothetical protein